MNITAIRLVFVITNTEFAVMCKLISNYFMLMGYGTAQM